MNAKITLGCLAVVTAFFTGMRALGEGRYLLAAGFAVLFLGFVAMVARECDLAGER